MKSVKVSFEEVNIPLNDKSIFMDFCNKLGESIFIIKTLCKYRRFVKYVENIGPIFEDKEEIKTRFLTINECSNGYTPIIDGHFWYDYHDEIIIGVCKLNIKD